MTKVVEFSLGMQVLAGGKGQVDFLENSNIPQNLVVASACLPNLDIMGIYLMQTYSPVLDKRPHMTALRKRS